MEAAPPSSPNPKKRKRGAITSGTFKYWLQRYSLFSLYDRGIKMDEEGWFSVTPESIAADHARRAAGRAVVDCFSGVGGNAIQFASRCCHVVAIEIDPRKVGFARNNAKIYGVEDNIDFVIGDFFCLAPHLKDGLALASIKGCSMDCSIGYGHRLFEVTDNSEEGSEKNSWVFDHLYAIAYLLASRGDVVFLAPPWGGPSYSKVANFTLDLLKPKDGYAIFQIAHNITPNIMMFLPRNVDLNQVEGLSWLSSPPLDFEVEENRVKSNLKGITAYFGDIASISSGLS